MNVKSHVLLFFFLSLFCILHEIGLVKAMKLDIITGFTFTADEMPDAAVHLYSWKKKSRLLFFCSGKKQSGAVKCSEMSHISDISKVWIQEVAHQTL